LTFAFDSLQQEKVWRIIEQVNDAWLNKNYQPLESLLHENMQIVDADLNVLGDGRDACIRSYRDFVENANIGDFEVSDPKVNAFDQTAIAEYEFSIQYTMQEKHYGEKGKDVFVLTFEQKHWQAIWRMMQSVESE